MSQLSSQRILCLDLRASRFGYVVCAGPRDLLDWGTRTYGKATRFPLIKRLAAIQTLFAPSIILVRLTAEGLRTRRSVVGPAIKAVRTFAKRQSGAVRLIDDQKLHDFFSSEMKVNKYDIARIVADRFPELSWRLPPKRRPWESEPSRQSIFDAARMGIFYFAQQVGAPIAG